MDYIPEFNRGLLAVPSLAFHPDQASLQSVEVLLWLWLWWSFLHRTQSGWGLSGRFTHQWPWLALPDFQHSEGIEREAARELD